MRRPGDPGRRRGAPSAPTILDNLVLRWLTFPTDGGQGTVSMAVLKTTDFNLAPQRAQFWADVFSEEYILILIGDGFEDDYEGMGILDYFCQEYGFPSCANNPNQ